ncbi:MAG: metal-dependent hydrolase [Candidatus Dojkabacteria bacterium]|nr:metal-dependent hydrolase [Candidatus Dojkabacteria bacterium]MDQ7021291.1 metal-dependent hydrolase [Candidatus Dojkabacteria bacterium]
MHIKFIAQSGFIISLENGQSISIDLWLNNPLMPLELVDVPKMDYVFTTHDHGDHDLTSAIEIAKRDNAWFTSSYGIAKYASEQGVEKVERGNVGGEYSMGDLDVIQTLAFHSSDIGNPVGFIIETNEGTIYHMGDTGYFNELKFYGELYDIDILMVPIGSRYTMDSLQASFATADINPEIVIPMHYNTFPAIQQDPKEFEFQVKERECNAKVKIMKPGDVLEY